MFNSIMKAVRGKGREGGFTLVELLIVILIVGILAAVAIPLYLGYTKDAKLAEGKALLGSVMTALQGCVQAKGSGQSCAVSEIVNRVGVSTAGVTGDGRWTVTTSGSTPIVTNSSSHPIRTPLKSSRGAGSAGGTACRRVDGSRGSGPAMQWSGVKPDPHIRGRNSPAQKPSSPHF